MASLAHSEEDRRLVERQVGRPLRGKWAVARRCHLGVPMTVENHPVLDDGSPFPTLFWLTCPLLVKRASALEAQGRMNELNKVLTEKAELHDRLAESTDRLLTRRDRHAVIAPSSAPPGGGPDKVKCLHAHLAHELSDPPNPVGALTLAQVGWPDCRVPCVEAET